MKKTSNKAAAILLLLLVPFVSGCGGYARTTNNNGSGVQVYGTVDAGVQHQRSH